MGTPIKLDLARVDRTQFKVVEEGGEMRAILPAPLREDDA